MKRSPFILFAFSIFSLSNAYAEHFNCDLTLNLIENSSSTEIKQLIFDTELNPNSKNITTGRLITSTCFGTQTEAFTSDSTKLTQYTIGDLTQGSLKDPSIQIGLYHYQINFKFSGITKNPNDENGIAVIASGKIRSHDNENFIHQIIKGECHFSKEQKFSMNFLTVPIERCKQNKEI